MPNAKSGELRMLNISQEKCSVLSRVKSEESMGGGKGMGTGEVNPHEKQ